MLAEYLAQYAPMQDTAAPGGLDAIFFLIIAIKEENFLAVTNTNCN